MSYQDFIARKLDDWQPVGFKYDCAFDGLYPHQDALVRWAIRLGRAAIFADTGLGKTRMQVEWADVVSRYANGSILILAPLAVAEQTVEESARIGIRVTHVRDDSDIDPSEGCGIFITNYERLHLFDTSEFVGVVLDESSIIKHHDAKTLQTLLDAFRDTPYRLCATATQRLTTGLSLVRTQNFSASVRDQKCFLNTSCTTAARRKSGALRDMRGKHSGDGFQAGAQ